MIHDLEDRFNQLRFELRTRFLGPLRLRRGLPAVRETEALRREREFYRLAIGTICPDEALRAAFDLCWDIGCRNWSYAPALAEMFPRARLLGVELDGSLRYWNLYRRMDVVQAMTQDLTKRWARPSECRFGDFGELPWESVSAFAHGTRSWLFCFFFPFVWERPCRKWGLPGRYADFGRLIGHARDLAQDGGATSAFLSAHQGAWELDLALEAYSRMDLAVRTESLGPESFRGLWPSSHEVTLIFASARAARSGSHQA